VTLPARSATQPGPSPVAELEGVSRERGRSADGFRLEIERFRIAPGERVAIVGPSGSGKSTFLDLLALSLAPGSADLFRMEPGGVDVAALWRAGHGRSLARLRRERIGYVLQGGALLPFLSAARNIELPLRLSGSVSAGDRERVQALVARLGLGGLSHRRPGELSFGQRQRVAVARALVHRPPLVLADEPTASLDAEGGNAVMMLMNELAREQGSAVLLVTHDKLLAARHGFASVLCRPVASALGQARSIIRRDP
jgi:putative ABC transport system ATP-binding protein